LSFIISSKIRDDSKNSKFLFSHGHVVYFINDFKILITYYGESKVKITTNLLIIFLEFEIVNI